MFLGSWKNIPVHGACLLAGTLAGQAKPVCLSTQRGQASPTITGPGSLSVSLSYLLAPTHLVQDPEKPWINADTGPPGRSQHVPRYLPSEIVLGRILSDFGNLRPGETEGGGCRLSCTFLIKINGRNF